MLAHEQLELRDDLLMVSERELRIDQVHHGAEPLLLEPFRLVPCERLERHVGKRRTPPEREPRAESLTRLLVVAGGGEVATFGGQVTEAGRVERSLVDAKEVPRRPRSDRVGTEHAAQ